jgi:hypothetical protein
VATTNLKGDLEGYGMVWLQRDGIANVTSLSRASDNFLIDSEYDHAAQKFRLYKPDGSAWVFKHKNGLYVSEVRSGSVLINTISDNKSKCCRLQEG